ncbi:MAG: hypothetical protein QGD96_11875 [Anaerolineae bacterium]|nr:hypothetical protein [Anaerolineae bacterium]
MATTASATQYQMREIKSHGAISGKVLLGNAIVESETIPITKDHESCGTGTRTMEWVRASGDALLDVVVYLDKVEAGKPFLKEAEAIVVDQKNCRFTPYLQVMANGGEIKVLNTDPVLHNVRAFELFPTANNRTMRRTIFNVSLPDFETYARKVSLRRGRALKLECSAHSTMHAWVFLARNPYYAVVDKNGAFTITDVPPGTYTVKSWHGRLGEQELTVEVKANVYTEVTFSY